MTKPFEEASELPSLRIGYACNELHDMRVVLDLDARVVKREISDPLLSKDRR